MPAPRATPLNSAAREISATLDWLEDELSTACRPIITQPPLVLLRVRGHPAHGGDRADLSVELEAFTDHVAELVEDLR